jgi:2,4-didehydro-3-deoxy-L-rhamnonate hydrolase
MQQFIRVLQEQAVIPALVSENGLLDLRSLIADITPETIASGVLNEVNAATLSPLAGDVQYLPPIDGVRQIPATGFNYKKHIEETRVPTPA